MPLSEQEQRLLDEMERNLYRNDADFVSTAGDQRGRPSYRSIAIGSVVGILGVGALVTGVVLQQPIVGIIGFVVMFAGVMIAITPRKHHGTLTAEDVLKEAQRPSASKKKAASGGTFMNRMNSRWDRRQDDRGE
jgi:predicted lipid-binding transport protein (Tim44 family)